MNRRPAALIAATGFLLGLVASAAQALASDDIEPLRVHDTAQLIAALQPSNAGRRIELAAGEYLVDRPLAVPDGTTLVGAGTIQLDDDGLPRGFATDTASTLRVVGGFSGSVLTLGNGSAIQGLRVVDLPNTDAEPRRRLGNVVLVASRRPADRVVASVVDCEIINPNQAGFTDDGPYGHGVAALTLNPSLGAPPAAHEGAAVAVRVERSLVRTQTGAVVFAINFAARGRIAVSLEGNQFDGLPGRQRRREPPGRGDRRRDRDRVATEPLHEFGPGPLRLDADRRKHVAALLGRRHSGRIGRHAAGRCRRRPHRGLRDRHRGYSGASRREPTAPHCLTTAWIFRLDGTRIASVGERAADLVLRGALSEIEAWVTPGEFAAGDRNVLRASLNDVTGSGVTRNRYADIDGPVQPANAGIGNRLIIEGTLKQFRQGNRGIEPEPSAEFFGAAH